MIVTDVAIRQQPLAHESVNTQTTGTGDETINHHFSHAMSLAPARETKKRLPNSNVTAVRESGLPSALRDPKPINCGVAGGSHSRLRLVNETIYNKLNSTNEL